jgi:deoxyribose-phosphate aldolase
MQDLNKYIDQTILKPDAREKDIREFLEGVNRYCFCAAVVNPCWVELVRKNLAGETKVCSVVGFPLGSSSTEVKVFEVEDLVRMGCDEIDMVMNRDFKYVGKEIKAVVEAAQSRVVKVIIETCLLTDEEKIAAANIIKESNARFVKTSTGFSRQGAQVEDVRLLRKTVGPDFGIKASGGIRDLGTALDLIRAGANRLGTSAGIRIMEQTQKIM